MSFRLSSRALALLAGASLVFGATTVAVPAFADDASAAAPAPVTTHAVAAPGTVDYTGRVTQVSDEKATANPDVQLFRVVGSGYLQVDLSKVDLGGLVRADVTLRFAVPGSLTLSDDADTKFQQLADYSTGTAPLVATGIVPASSSRVKALVNQSPITSGTQTIYAVLVTPKEWSNTTVSANQTDAKVRESVAHADAYWSAQSGGKVHFQLAGTATWYKSTKSCISGSSALWTEAAAKATAQLGYRDAFNVHLALFFPSDATSTKCGGAIGLGTIGTSVNSGGLTWVVGTNGPMEQETLAHELGHNLTFGHADLLDCHSTDPHPDFLANGCSIQHYGDVTDAMGYGTDGTTGGAVSSPNAIRSGIWSSSDYVSAPSGTNTYVLNSVSSHSGTRAIVVEDTNGVDYFVEFRNQTGEDAQYADYGCFTDACAASTPGVRVLRLEQQSIDFGDFSAYFKGVDGDDAFLIERTGGGPQRIDYHQNESFSSGLGVTIAVTGVTANTATVQVTRAVMPVSSSYVTIYPTMSHDTHPRVGDTWTAMLEADWIAQSYTFQWYRDGTPISGASAQQQSYTLAAADLGHDIGASVTGTTSGVTATSTDPDFAAFDGYGPIEAAVTDPLPIGSVSVANASSSLQAVPAGWPDSTTFAYQWYRDATAIAGAITDNYTPTAADLNHLLKVRVIGSKTGFLSSTTFSAPKDYSISVSGGANGIPTVTPVENPRVGDLLTANSTLTYSTADGPVASPTLSYQWYRTGVAIAGATNSSYALTSADLAKTLTVAITAKSQAYAPRTVTSLATLTITAGFIDTGDAAVTVDEPTSARLLVSHLTGTIATAGTNAPTFQWYRALPTATVPTAIVGATASSYTLTSADIGRVVTVRYVIAKTGYTSQNLFAPRKNYSTTLTVPTAKPVISGTLKVGEILATSIPAFSTVDGAAASPVLAYQWYRSGIAVAGAAGTSPTYTLTASDYAKVVSVRVTGWRDGYLPVAATSAATAKVGLGVLPGTLAPIVTKNVGDGTFSLTVSDKTTDGVTDLSAVRAYQWYRSGVAIAGATELTYCRPRPTSANCSRCASSSASSTTSRRAPPRRPSTTRSSPTTTTRSATTSPTSPYRRFRASPGSP